MGTRGGEIVEFGVVETEAPRVLLRSHYDGELCGLAPHPRKSAFLTVGHESVLGIWDIK